MGKHKPMSILKRTPGQQDKRKAAQPPEQGSPLKRQKPPPAKERPTSHGKPYTALHMNTPANKRVKAATERLSTGGSLRPGSWEAVSIVDRQAARAVQQLLQADASGRGGASIKSLTLAPSIEAKKATHAVTCPDAEAAASAEAAAGGLFPPAAASPAAAGDSLCPGV